MANKQSAEDGGHRSDRLKRKGLVRIEDAASEERALDAAVRRSIRLYGP